MSEPRSLHLTLTAERVERYCRDTVRYARDPAHALTGLVAVQTFLSTQVGPGDEGYGTIRGILEKHIDQAQGRVLEQAATDLASALRGEDAAALARVHAPLSRSGFRSALEQTWQGLEPSERPRAADWVRRWCRDARARAEAASGYPDALDLSGAGVDLKEYAALTDVAGFLEG